MFFTGTPTGSCRDWTPASSETASVRLGLSSPRWMAQRLLEELLVKAAARTDVYLQG
jgi:hypothetical protein